MRTTNATPSTWLTCCAWAGCRGEDRPAGDPELRELGRYRAKLVVLRSGLKAQVHAVMAIEGVLTLRAMGRWPRRANRSYDSTWAAELG